MPPARRATRERPPRERRHRPPREPGEGSPRERRQRPELLSRILIAVPAAILAVVMIDVGGTAWTVFMALMACACLQELYAMLDRWRPVALVGFVAAVAMCFAARYGGLRDVMEVAMAAIPVTFLAVIARTHVVRPTVSIAGTLLGVVWIGLAFAHAVLLRQLPHGKGIVIDIAVGTFLGDTGAYLGGRLFGRRPLAPATSPNKTVEGLFCGMIVAIIAVYFASLYQSSYMSAGKTFGLGVAVAVLGPIGDLFESLVKRDAGAKDAGTLFGAHGGALDRLDAVIFTIVAGYYVWAAALH